MKCLHLILRSISSEKYGGGGSLWLVLFHGISCRGQAEKEFKVEVEAIGRVRHKNLVRLLGYCAEGAHRYFVSSKLAFLSLLWNLDTAFARKISTKILNCGMGGLIQLFVLFRMLVYEYVDNGNLEQWLHGDVGPCSPLTWDIRMNVVLGTTKGYINF